MNIEQVKVLHPDWIDHNLLRRWKMKCDSLHFGRCQLSSPAPRHALERPRWLIDTWTQNLVAAPPEVSYIALSYVWGQTVSLKTVKSNLAQPQMPGVLSSDPYLSKMSVTIKDAISVLKLMRERFLWVDMLCIVQDDNVAKLAEISDMASIFSNASVTIVASEGADADFGLRGLRNHSQKRRHNQKLFKLANGAKILQSQRSRTTLAKPFPWYQRGWTYQEDIFSHRKLYFEDGCIKWRCKEAFWCEDSVDDISLGPKPNSANFHYMASSAFPDLERFCMMVNSYNIRELTFPRDALDAFAGVLNALSALFDGGFLCGLPVLFLDISLLWQPEVSLTSRRLGQTSENIRHLPSWTWAGWQGPVQLLRSIECHYLKKDYFTNGRLESNRTVPITQWYSLNPLESSPIPVGSSWYEYEKKYLNTTERLPSGWQRHVYYLDGERAEHAHSPERPSCFYTHNSWPETEFGFPSLYLIPTVLPARSQQHLYYDAAPTGPGSALESALRQVDHRIRCWTRTAAGAGCCSCIRSLRSCLKAKEEI
jgi:hypothetical protein